MGVSRGRNTKTERFWKMVTFWMAPQEIRLVLKYDKKIKTRDDIHSGYEIMLS